MFTKLSHTNGWVNNITHHQSPNQRQGMSVPHGVRGLLMHTMVGNLPGTDQEFENRAAQVSAHFGIGQNGEVIQWVNITGGIAWAEAAGNDQWYSVEHADNGNPNEPLTLAQMQSAASILELCSRVGNFPLQEANSTSGEGYGVHSMGGAAWGGHTCPDLPPNHVRSRQRPQIIAMAQTLRDGHATPPVKVSAWVSAGQLSLNDLASQHLKNAVSTIVRLTAEHSPGAVFTTAMAAYINAVFSADKVKVPKGVELYLGTSWFTSKGDQTLLGIADVRKLHPAGVLQATAEKSSGSIFAGNIANYIDSVFSRSSLHVPSGTHVFYES
jgi:hypothetical protein